MSNLIEIQSQIEKLQKQAADIKTREFDKTIQEILAKMQAFGISLTDLQSAMGKRAKTGAGKKRGNKSGAAKAPVKRGRQPSKQAGIKVAPKYRGPNGETWSGRGVMPRWLATLVAQGQTRESFAIKG